MSAFPKKRLSATADFYDFIHPSERKETVVLWNKTLDSKAWTCVSANESISSKLDELNYKTDIYFSPNEFYKWRLGKNLRRLTCFYVDVDCRNSNNLNNEDYNDYIINILQKTLCKLEGLNIPSPNCVVYTGRGFHLYWRFKPVGKSCVERWRTATKKLIEIIDDADPACADPTRMMRLPNTYNSKNGVLSDLGFLCNDYYSFDDLCNSILPYTRSEIRDFRAARAKRGLSAKKSRSGKQYGSIYERWFLVYQDIQKIIVHHFNNNNKKSVPKGMRDRLLFHAANALSWFTHKEALEREIKDLAAKYFSSLDIKEAISYCSSVMNRAKKTTTGEELRYKYKSETLYSELEDLIPFEIKDDMRGLVGIEERRKRKCSRQRAYRASKGAVSRAQYLDAAQERRTRAKRLLGDGFTKKSVAKMLGVSISTVKNYLRQLSKKPKSKPRSMGVSKWSKSVALYSGRRPELFVFVGVGMAVSVSGDAVLKLCCLSFKKINKKRRLPSRAAFVDSS